MSHHYSAPDYGFPNGDARLDLTDLYAFPAPREAGKSVLVMNVHPSVSVSPPGPTTDEPFSHEAAYEFMIDTEGDLLANVVYRVRFSPFVAGRQSATLHRIEGSQVRGAADRGDLLIDGASVSMAGVATVTEASGLRLFAG